MQGWPGAPCQDSCSSIFLFSDLDSFFLDLLKVGLQILRGRGDNFIYQKHLRQDKGCYRERCSNISAGFSTPPPPTPPTPVPYPRSWQALLRPGPGLESQEKAATPSGR